MKDHFKLQQSLSVEDLLLKPLYNSVKPRTMYVEVTQVSDCLAKPNHQDEWNKHETPCCDCLSPNQIIRMKGTNTKHPVISRYAEKSCPFSTAVFWPAASINER